jgi:hypothetical protein
VEWRQGLSDTVRVWSGSLVFAEYSFPFQSKTKDRNMLENTLVLYERDMIEGIYISNVCNVSFKIPRIKYI